MHLKIPDMAGEICKIISDGQFFYLILDENTVLLMESPIISKFDFSTQCSSIDISSIGEEKKYISGLASHSLDFSLVSNGPVTILTEQDGVEVDFLRRLSIRDLLKEINQKINKRG